MKKVAIFLLALFGVGLSGLYAQQYQSVDGFQVQENTKTFAQRLEEGVRTKTPSRLTFYGELYARGWIGGESLNRVVQGADASGDDSFLGMLWEFTNFTGILFEITAIPEENRPDLFLQKAYVFSDIAGEAGSENMVARVSLGRFDFDSDFLSLVDPMGTGDDIQHDDSSDIFNWKLEVGTKGEDVFPIIFMVASDLDFGYREPGGITDYNNKGVSGLFEVRSVGYNIADVVTLSWNAYYGGRYVANLTTSITESLNRTSHSIGGTIGMSIALAPGHLVDVGAGLEYDMWTYGGGASDPRLNRNMQAMDWQAGVAYIMENQFAVALGMRQDAVNHAEYAAVTGNSALTEFILGASINYLGLKEIAKLSFYTGLGYSFGSLFESDLYKNAWNDGAGNEVYGGINNYEAGSPFSADVGMGYHPTTNASMFIGYQYGRYGVEAPDGANRDFKGNWGKFYVKGAYIW